MDDDSRIGTGVKVGMGALGLGAVGAVVMDRHYGIWIAAGIVVLFLLLFGGYFIWRRVRSRRQRERFSSAIEAQTAAAPKSISDPNKRAALDKLRQKFQTGLQEFRSRGKDIYKLPWFAIIGEPGSGKTEAIRHSGIDFPPGLQDELQGSGGTVNMDWWFTNRGIILDTAGSMIFGEASAGEAPEWREFLRLLKKSRPHCPINGLFLVLSIESLIKDSADTISKKASRLAQQLDIIQRTLDVRFPVYLLVTKCDLLAGFREFFDSIDDPLLQHQIFGWSNPEPLDSHFRPDLIDKHLTSIADRLRRRRMALLRDNSTAGRLGDTSQIFSSSYQLGRAPTPPRRLDEMDAMFALPESIMRLSPRLRLYLETVFVAGEWSAKPVFLRGIYFTTSMREGKALDEAIAQATGLSLDQLPEERNWDKKRAFFLRDLFHEKIFREAGLVTRATNTLKLLRTRQLAIFGSAGAALLILLVVAWFGYRSLQNSVGMEAAYWRAGTNGWEQGVASKWWSSGSIVRFDANNVLHYAGTNQIPGLDEKLTVVGFHNRLRQLASRQLSVGWIFKPIFWIGSRGASDRAAAQRVLFEHGVLAPLIEQTRARMTNSETTLSSPADVARHRDALQSLMMLEADGLTAHANSGEVSGSSAEVYLKSFTSYLTGEDVRKPDTNLLDTFAWTYSKNGSGDGKWPPKFLLSGNSLDDNPAIKGGMGKFYLASKNAQTNIDRQLVWLKDFTDNLIAYHQAEVAWLTNTTGDPCSALAQTLRPTEDKVVASWAGIASATNATSGLLTNMAGCYAELGKAASNASAAALYAPVEVIMSRLPEASRGTGLFKAIQTQLQGFVHQAGEGISTSYNERSNWMATLDAYQLARFNGNSSHEARWNLYTNACSLAAAPINVTEDVVGDGWMRFGELQKKADQFRSNLAAYNGPLADLASNECNRIAGEAEQRLKHRFVGDYVALVKRKMSDFSSMNAWTPDELTKAGNFLTGVEVDLKPGAALDDDGKRQLIGLDGQVGQCRKAVMASIGRYAVGRLRFPLVPPVSANDPGMSLAEMDDARAQVNGFVSELLKTNWRATASDLRLLQAGAGRLNSLLADGEPPVAAKCKIYFMPPNDDDTTGKTIISIYRNARFSFGQTRADWSDDLATMKDDKLVAEGTVDAPVKISFRLDADAPDSSATTKELANWGLLRMIYDNKSQDGTNLVIRVPLENKQTSKSGTVQSFKGDVQFKVVLDRPLPKIE